MTRRWAACWVLALAGIGLLLVLIGPALAPLPVDRPVGLPWDPAHGSLGTDQLGRDLGSRLLAGGSGLLAAVPIGLATTVLGGVLGLAAVQSPRGRRVLQASSSALLAVPGVLIVLAAAVRLPSWLAVAVVMALLGVPLSARIVAASGARLTTAGFVEVARLRRDGRWRIAVRELAPVLLPVLVADAGVRGIAALHLMVGVHVLGLGPQPPTADWGLMLRENLPGVMLAPLSVLAPAAAIAALACCVVIGVDTAADLLSGPHRAARRLGTGVAEFTPGAGTLLTGLVISRDGAPVLVADRFEAPPGRITAVCGPTGAGKSTLLSVLAREPGAGLSVTGRGRILSGNPAPTGGRWRRTRVGLLEQDPAETLDPRQRIGILLRRAGWEDPASALISAGLSPDLRDRRAGTLSGGQAARVALLRALAGRPQLVLADEPTAALDEPSADVVAELLTTAAAAGTTVVVVSHDLAWVQRYADVRYGLQVGDGQPARLVPGADTILQPPPRTPATPGPIRLACRELSVGAGGTPLLTGVSLSIGAGEWVALRGPSGIGKTTLLRALCGLVAPAAGTISRSGRLQWIAQDSSQALNPAHSLGRSITDSAISPERGRDLANELGLAAVLLRRPAECSGGERQRAALARALSAGGEVLVIDEPTSALDGATAAMVLRVLGEARDAGYAVLMVTHDDLAAAHADRVIEVTDWAVPART